MEPVPYFLSYAHADGDDVRRFNEVLAPQLATDARYQFRLWMDTAILPGVRWREEIEKALQACRFGLLLVSPAFLASEFITKNELQTLLDKPMVVPVMLHPISFNGTMDLKGLADRQVYRDPEGRSFDQCGRKQTRRAFALDLHQKINALLQVAMVAAGEVQGGLKSAAS